MGLETSLPVIGGLLDPSAGQGMDQLKKNQALWDSIQTPNLKWENYDPEAYSSEMTDAQTVKEDPSLLSGQMDVLNNMAGLGQRGLSEVDDAAFDKSRDEAQQIAKQGTDAALQSAANRGVGGSGLEFAMREMANQGASNRSQDANLAQNADSAKMRAMYEQAYGQQLGQVRGQNYNTAANNTNILNQFNQANTAQRNATNAANVNMSNQAQQTNQAGRTGIQQQNFNNAITKAGGQAQANSGMAQGYAAQNAANTADRNMWTQIGATAATAGMTGGAGGTKMTSQQGLPYTPGGMAHGGIVTAKDEPSGWDNIVSNLTSGKAKGNHSWNTPPTAAPGMAWGGHVSGMAPVPGDSPLNDTVPKMLSPGEMVIPRSHAQSPLLAKAFVDHLFGKHK